MRAGRFRRDQLRWRLGVRALAGQKPEPSSGSVLVGGASAINTDITSTTAKLLVIDNKLR